MSRSGVIHKKSRRCVEVYAGLGQYESIPAPVCEGPAGLYRGRSYLVTRNWKDVTCKNCLRSRKTETDVHKEED